MPHCSGNTGVVADAAASHTSRLDPACRLILATFLVSKELREPEYPPIPPLTHPLASAMLSRQALRSLRAAAPQRTIARSTVRSYAAAADTQNVKPPISLYGLDGTYATALVRYIHPHPSPRLNCSTGCPRFTPWSIGARQPVCRRAKGCRADA